MLRVISLIVVLARIRLIESIRDITEGIIQQERTSDDDCYGQTDADGVVKVTDERTDASRTEEEKVERRLVELLEEL